MAVAMALEGQRTRYKECLRSGGAVPEVRSGTRPNEVNEQSLWLEDVDRSMRGWYVLFCDPALPEARGPRGAVQGPWD